MSSPTRQRMTMEGETQPEVDRRRLPTRSGSGSSIIFDSSSISDSSTDKRQESKKAFTLHTLTTLSSIVYAIFVVVVASIFYLFDMTSRRPSGSATTSGLAVTTSGSRTSHNYHQSFNSALCVVGLIWLVFLHYDIQRYKKRVMRSLFPKGVPSLSLLRQFRSRSSQSDLSQDIDLDQISATNTEVIFNTVNNIARRTKVTLPEGVASPPPMRSTRSASIASIALPTLAFDQSYRFSRGRHSSGFYLKVGMAAFCFGHMIHELLKAGHQVYYFSSDDKTCQDVHQLVLHTIRPIYSFYQLFMLFKYSNIVIHRLQVISAFALMHLIATSISFWIGAILDDAIDFYILHHVFDMAPDSTNATTDAINATIDSIITATPDSATTTATSLTDFITESRSVSDMVCQASLSSSISSSRILPYMYPFSIEYNLCLAVMWFIIWSNVGSEDGDHDGPSGGHPFQGTVVTEDGGREDVHYESNLVIRADCHASNKGLFSGIFILLLSLVMMIMFFISSASLPKVAYYVFTMQEVMLVTLLLVATMSSYYKTSRLDLDVSSIVRSPTMDTILLMVPIPCFILSYMMSIVAEVATGSGLLRPILLVFMMVQVILQTIFIIDASHRCSHDKKSRIRKPGREMVTLSILLNLTCWIVYTFETKAAESFFPEVTFYGETTWMVVSHTTLPLMLFYRFHSSVCLADIWKFAYEGPAY